MTVPRSVIERVIDASIRHRAIVIGATLALAAAGIWAFATLKTDAFPDLTPNQVLVMTEAPGLSPVEVENQVTYPMEVAMLGLPRTTDVRSISKVGLSVVTVTFEDDVDLYFARAQVQQRMQDAMMPLPDGAEPMLGPPATAMGEVFQYLVEADDGGATTALTLLNLTNVQEYMIEPLLRTVPGVADVNAWGGMRAAVRGARRSREARRLRPHAPRHRDGAREQQRELRRRIHRGPRRAPDAARPRACRRHGRHRQRRRRDARRDAGLRA